MLILIKPSNTNGVIHFTNPLFRNMFLITETQLPEVHNQHTFGFNFTYIINVPIVFWANMHAGRFVNLFIVSITFRRITTFIGTKHPQTRNHTDSVCLSKLNNMINFYKKKQNSTVKCDIKLKYIVLC
jgi:hypothetical protein